MTPRPRSNEGKYVSKIKDKEALEADIRNINLSIKEIAATHDLSASYVDKLAYSLGVKRQEMRRLARIQKKMDDHQKKINAHAKEIEILEKTIDDLRQ